MSVKVIKFKGVIFIYSYQMIGIADENGRTYESKYGTYSKKDGFKLSELSKSMTKEKLLNNLFHEDCWSLKKNPIRMTKKEIEEKLGYEIEINEPEERKLENNQNISKNAQKSHKNVFADDIFDFLFW